MNRWLIWLGTGSIAAIAVLTTLVPATRAHYALSSERSKLRVVAHHAKTVSHLTDHRVTINTADQRTLTERVSSVLTESHLRLGVLESLSPESTTSTRRRATLVLSPITLPELGRFLAAWNLLEPSWVVSDIDLVPIRQRDSTPGSDLPLRATLTATTIRSQESSQ